MSIPVRVTVQFENRKDAAKFAAQVIETGEILVEYGTGEYENGYPIDCKIVEVQ